MARFLEIAPLNLRSTAMDWSGPYVDGRIMGWASWIPKFDTLVHEHNTQNNFQFTKRSTRGFLLLPPPSLWWSKSINFAQLMNTTRSTGGSPWNRVYGRLVFSVCRLRTNGHEFTHNNDILVAVWCSGHAASYRVACHNTPTQNTHRQANRPHRRVATSGAYHYANCKWHVTVCRWHGWC